MLQTIHNIYRYITLTLLPEDIYFCIQAFTSINALLNTSRRFNDVKRRRADHLLINEFKQCKLQESLYMEPSLLETKAPRFGAATLLGKN
jgi:hypothetical protein